LATGPRTSPVRHGGEDNAAMRFGLFLSNRAEDG
jgi:hypothetical protein